MILRTKAVYVIHPVPEHPNRHAIPVEAAQHVLNDPEALPSSLNHRQCLAKVVVVDHDKVVARYPSTLIRPDEESYLVCNEDQFPHFPTHLSEHARLVVELVVID